MSERYEPRTTNPSTTLRICPERSRTTNHERRILRLRSGFVPSAAERRKRGRLFVISAPSGCGKTTLCKRLIADDLLGISPSISVTTRPPRAGEKEGVDYRFVSRAKFLGMTAKNIFLEYEENFGHFYGTPASFIKDGLEKGKAILLNIDVKGAMKVRKAYPRKSVLIFILPPSAADLKKRLRSRMTDSHQTIASRLKLARREMSYAARYDYRVINRSLDSAYRRLKKIIIDERLKTGRRSSHASPAVKGRG